MSEDKEYDGVVIWFNKGFGFISWEIDGVQQSDLFLHFSDISMDGFKTLHKDQKIRFKVGQNQRGQPKAIAVVAVK